MALRCAAVILGISIPCVVDFISRSEDAFGVIVPMPALPVDGNVFVCAWIACIQNVADANTNRFIFFIVDFL